PAQQGRDDERCLCCRRCLGGRRCDLRQWLRLQRCADTRKPEREPRNKQGLARTKAVLVGVKDDRPLSWIAIYTGGNLGQRLTFLDRVIRAASLGCRRVGT